MALSRKKSSSEDGFSVIETLVVLAIIIVMTAAAVFALYPHRRAYRSDDAANKIVNFMRDAYQRALTQRQSMLLRIDRTEGTISIIDEGLLPNGDEAMVRKDVLVDASEVRMDRPMVNGALLNPPTAPYNYAPAAFDNGVWEVRFRSDGSVVDTSSAPAPLSATLFFWPTNPGNDTTPSNAMYVRAVTLFGPSGSIRYWRFDGERFAKEVN